MASYLPSTDDGYLPYWLLLVCIPSSFKNSSFLSGLKVSLTSALNSVQCYITTSYTERVYSSPSRPVTRLSARTFGTWTFLSSIIRLYGAYNISDPVIYQLVLWTYALAFGHFASEWFYFGTAKWGAGLAGPVLVSTGSLAWMFWQWGWYTD